MGAGDDEIAADDLALLDEVAEVAADGASLSAITGLYAAHPELQVPHEILER